jgi:hypothetical protein
MRRPLIIALLLTVPAVLSATVLVPIEFRELVSLSSTIVHGRVVDVHTEWIDGRRSIETLVTIDADEYLKGGPGATLTVRTPGGQMGRYRTIFVGAPEFRQGDEVVLFLRSYNGRLSIVGLSQGAFRVMPDASGRRLVTSPVVMGKPGADSEPVVRGDAARRPMAIDAFRDLVRRVMAGGGAQ